MCQRIRFSTVLLLPLLAWNTTAATASDALPLADLFVSGDGGFHTYRIPALVTTNKGTLLVFCEGRKTSRVDDGDNDLLMRRSTDQGKTWSESQLVHEEGGDAIITIGNACPLVDRTTGIVWLAMNRGNDDILLTHSKDDGRSWATVRDITRQVKKPEWGWYATGPGVGIQLLHGQNWGRLVIPCDHRETKDRGGPSRSHVIYSDDHGATWKIGGMLGYRSNECQIAERMDGSLLINARNHLARDGNPTLGKKRLVAISNDEGLSFANMSAEPSLIEPTCQASLISYPRVSKTGESWMLFANPASTEARENLTIRLSRDGGASWKMAKQVYAGSSAYSSLCVLKDGRVGIVFERDDYKRISFTTLSVDSFR